MMDMISIPKLPVILRTIFMLYVHLVIADQRKFVNTMLDFGR